jgi:hypothetical protein
MKDDRIGEAEREGQRERMYREPKRLLKGGGGVNIIYTLVIEGEEGVLTNNQK